MQVWVSRFFLCNTATVVYPPARFSTLHEVVSLKLLPHQVRLDSRIPVCVGEAEWGAPVTAGTFTK